MKESVFHLLLGLVISIFSTQSVAENGLRLDLVTYMRNIYGTCIGAKVSGTVVTPQCQNVVVDIGYPDGRRNLIGMLGNGELLITFSGSKESTPMPDKYELKLDRVTLVSRNQPAKEVPGSGTCTLFDHKSEGLTILCFLKSQSGNYELAFLGNGDVKWEKRK
jgi:hypothetical protein